VSGDGLEFCSERENWRVSAITRIFLTVSGDLNALAAANQRFHGAIVEMAESDRLNSLMQQVLAEMRLFFHRETVDVAFYSRYLQENELIAEALSAGDFRGSGDLLLEYLRRSEDHLMSIYLYGEGRRD